MEPGVATMRPEAGDAADEICARPADDPGLLRELGDCTLANYGAWKRCLNGIAENVVGSGRDARGRTTVLPKALAERRWRPGQSGNPAGHTGEYGEVMKIARSYAPAAMHRLAELAELNQLDSEGYLVPLSDLPAADRRVIAVAANAILDRAFGKPKPAAEEKDNDMEARLKAMTREERLAYAWELLEGARKYLPADEREGETIEGDSAEVEADD
jgi:hypothetical protein